MQTERERMMTAKNKARLEPSCAQIPMSYVQQTNLLLYLELAVAMSCSLSTSRCDGDTTGEKEILLTRSPASYLGDPGIQDHSRGHC